MSDYEEQRPRPIWAPPELPGDVTGLIESEQKLVDLNVRDIVAGLTSANSDEFNNAVNRLVKRFGDQFTAGWVAGRYASWRLLMLYGLGGAVLASGLWAIAWWLVK